MERSVMQKSTVVPYRWVHLQFSTLSTTYLSASIAPALRGVSPNPTRSHFTILIILYFYVSIALGIRTQLRTKYLPIFLYNNIIRSHFIVLHFTTSPFFASGLCTSQTYLRVQGRPEDELFAACRLFTGARCSGF